MVFYRRRFRRRYPIRRKRYFPKKGRKVFRRRKTPTVLPLRYKCKLKYAEEITIDVPIGGGAAVHEFRANDLYDPNITGVGHQPMGFDQLALFWNHFTVIGSRIRVKALSKSDGTVYDGVTGYYGVALSDTTGRYTGATISKILEEEGRSAVKPFGANNWIDTRFQGVTKSFSLKKYFNVSRYATGDDNYQCSNANSPIDQAIYTVFAAGVNGDNPTSVTLLVEIEYIAVCHEPVPLAQS